MVSPYKKDLYKLLDDIHNVYPSYKLPGEQSDPDQENVHLKTHITWGHKSASLHKIERHKDQFDIIVHFLTLAGVYGPLPDAQTEFILDKVKEKDDAILAFFDIFHHRLITCMYLNYRHCTLHMGSKNYLDTFVGYALYAISGLLFDHDKTSLNTNALANLHEAFWRNQKSPGGLLKVLRSYYGLPVDVSQFQGDWAYLPKHNRLGSWEYFNDTNRLGQRLITLNKNLYLGWRFFDPGHGIKITFHKLTWEQYLNFIPPSNTGINELRVLVRRYVGVETHVRVELELDPHEAHKAHLCKKSYLNYTTWLVNDRENVNEYKVSFKLF